MDTVHRVTVLFIVQCVLYISPYSTVRINPCPFLGSINITAGVRNPNTNTIQHNDLHYAPRLYRTFDYVDDGGANGRQNVTPHVRACATSRQTIGLCCSMGRYLDEDPHRNTACKPANRNTLRVEIFDTETTSSFEDLFEHFVYTMVCTYVQEMQNGVVWKLYKNGSFYKDSRLLDPSAYCLAGNYSDPDDILAFDCYPEVSDQHPPLYTFLNNIQLYALVISVPFLMATILVYAILPELRNVHGKALICYLLGLAIGYSCLVYVKLNDISQTHAWCTAIGYTLYFAFLVTFFWMHVIAFDLWWKFRGNGLIVRSPGAGRKKYLEYSVYAWGMPLAIVSLCALFDRTAWLPDALRPDIGDNACFFNTFVTKFMYFYILLIVIVISNATFFTLTALKIRRGQREIARLTASGDSHRTNLEQEKDNFGQFLRLFIVMGVSWSMEAIAFTVDEKSNWFAVTDLLNSAQGPLIFFMFVMKPNVRRLLQRRWNSRRGVATDRSHSGRKSSQPDTTSNNNTQELKSFVPPIIYGQTTEA